MVPTIADFGPTVYALIVIKNTCVLLTNYIRVIVVSAILTTKRIRIRFEPSPKDVPETFSPRNDLSCRPGDPDLPKPFNWKKASPMPCPLTPLTPF